MNKCNNCYHYWNNGKDDESCDIHGWNFIENCPDYNINNNWKITNQQWMITLSPEEFYKTMELLFIYKKEWVINWLKSKHSKEE